MPVRPLFLLVLALAIGCHSAYRCPPADGFGDPNCGPASHVAGAAGAPSCAAPTGAPCGAPRQPCQEIHVRAPRQKVRVQQPGQPAGAQLVEEQVAQTRQMVLVPQQVYVPFIQATNFGAVRVNGTQETQFFNAQGIATQGVVGTAGAAAFGAQAGSTQGTVGATRALTAEEALQCQRDLQAARSALSELNTHLRKLQGELETLKKDHKKASD